MHYTLCIQASLIYCHTCIYTLIVYTIVCGNTREGPIHRSLIYSTHYVNNGCYHRPGYRPLSCTFTHYYIHDIHVWQHMRETCIYHVYCIYIAPVMSIGLSPTSTPTYDIYLWDSHIWHFHLCDTHIWQLFAWLQCMIFICETPTYDTLFHLGDTHIWHSFV